MSSSVLSLSDAYAPAPGNWVEVVAPSAARHQNASILHALSANARPSRDLEIDTSHVYRLPDEIDDAFGKHAESRWDN